MSERNPASRFSVSLEMRFHFRHDGCRAGPGGWNLAEANLGRAYFCPWCGQQLEPPKPAGAEDRAKLERYAKLRGISLDEAVRELYEAMKRTEPDTERPH